MIVTKKINCNNSKNVNTFTQNIIDTQTDLLFTRMLYDLLFSKKYSKPKYKWYVQDDENGTSVSASFQFSVGNSMTILSQSNNLHLTIKPKDRSGDDIKIFYRAIAGTVENYVQFLNL